MNHGRVPAAPRRPRAAASQVTCRRLAAISAALVVSAPGWVSVATRAAAEAPGAPLVTAPAQLAAGGARSSAEVTIALSSLYGVSVPPGSWVPVAVSVANKGPTDWSGNIVLTSSNGVTAGSGPTTSGCFANGPSTFTCLNTGDFSSGLPSTPTGPARPGVSAQAASVGAPGVGATTYRIPLELAATTAKRLVVELLAEPATADVRALVEGPSGTLLARASTQVPLVYGPTEAAVLVVTDDQGAVSALDNLVSPAGSQPELQYTSPADLPTSPSSLGLFRAVAIDGADTTGLSPAQGQTLESYVEAGGTLVVAGGLNWRATTAGLPAGLLPASPTGQVSSLTLPSLPRILGTQPLAARVDVADVTKTPGAAITLSQGGSPITLQVRHGSGHVVFSAVDPAAPPLSGWPGITALLSWLFAPAYEPGYFASPLPYAEAGGLFPVDPGGLPPVAVAKLGTDGATGAALMSTAPAEDALAGYLEEAPIVTAPPSATFVGLLFLGYVLLAGPVCFLVLARLGRRQLAWVLVPSLAIAVTSVAVLASPRSNPAVQEVDVAQVAPGEHIAQVTALDVVPLPRGGSRRFELSTAAPVGVGASAGAALTGAGAGPVEGEQALVGTLNPANRNGLVVGPGKTLSTMSVTVSGGPRSFGGWAESEQVHLDGALHATVTAYGNVVDGTVTNDLGLTLTDAQVAVASGEATQVLGTVEPDASAGFNLAISPNTIPPPQAFGAPTQLQPSQVLRTSPGTPAAPGTPATGGGHRARPGAVTSTAGSARTSFSKLRASNLLKALSDLASSTSAQQGGAPVFVALVNGRLLPSNAVPPTTHVAGYEVIVAPLSLTFDAGQPGPPSLDIPGELVGSRGVTGENSYALTTGSLTLGTGGSFAYQFVLPSARWGQLQLDLGSSSGQTPGHPIVRVTAYNYLTSRWDTLPLRVSSGELQARIAPPARYVGPGNAVEIRIVAEQDGVEVYGAYPTLSATPPQQQP
ncbi:MAG TPA: hypothetical protein VEJ84_17245 [Acidimicrobiales bacterium]|nr:hypothetical protein [Acidimicrobiales bacterium]